MLIRRRTRSAGFTLAEVLVAVALIAVLAAVSVPTIRGRLQESYEDALVAELNNIQSALTAYRQDVGKYPPQLDYLFALRATPKDRCGNNLTATQIANWRGPYINRFIPAMTGTQGFIVASKDTIMDTLYAISPPTGLGILLVGPDVQTARNLDLRYDGAIGSSSGQVQYTIPGNTENITFIFPTKANAC